MNRCFVVSVLFFFVVVSTGGAPISGSSASYGELAAETCAPLWQNMADGLTLFSDEMLPNSDFVKPTRNFVRDVRDCIDLFAFAYPKSFPSAVSKQKNDDAFLELRPDLDDGYELIVDFRDLTYVNVSDKVVKKRRDAVLAWNASFAKHTVKHSYSQYVASPELTKLVLRPLHDLSSYYWGACDVIPQLNLTGMQNIALLERCLLKKAEKNYKTVYDLLKTVPLKAKEQETLHAYRKTIRAILAVYEFFPAVFLNDSSVTTAIDTLETAYDTFGDLENDIASYNIYEQDGSKKQIKEAKAELTTQTEELREWLKTDADLVGQLENLMQQLI